VQPPSAPPDFSEPLYEVYYGLREPPFALTTDPRFFFLSASHRQAYDDLLTGLRRREGLLVLTGDTGTGKTTMCRTVIEALGHRTFASLILNPYMSDAEILRVIVRDFGLVSRDEIRQGVFAKADMPQLLDVLETFLQSLIALSSYAVILIDEAQNLSARVLDQIRVLGSYEQDGQRLLQIVLVGQPSLLTTLASEPMRATNDRVSRRVALAPLTPSEVGGYIRHRLDIAGGKAGVSFTPDATALVAALSTGLPRRVNLLCDRTLEEGRRAGTTALGVEHVRRAQQALAGSPAVGAAAERDAESEAPRGDADRPRPSVSFGVVRKRTRSIQILPIVLTIAGVVILVAAIASGVYAWQLAAPSALPTLPAQPQLTSPKYVPGPAPTDEEIAVINKRALPDR
jgi:general secretion pathway protein A